MTACSRAPATRSTSGSPSASSTVAPGVSSGVVLTPEEAVRVAETAVAVARSLPDDQHPVEIAPEPTYDDVSWVSSTASTPCPWCRRRPRSWSTGRTGSHGSRGRPRLAHLLQVHECKLLRRPGRHPHHPAAGAAVPRLRGDGHRRRHLRLDGEHRAAGGPRLGYLVGGPDEAWGWDDEIEQVPELLAEKLKAPSVEAGTRPGHPPSNLWLTIHGPSATPPRARPGAGLRANYAGTSFATPDLLGHLQYGSPVLNVTGDRTVEHGLATIGITTTRGRHPAVGHRPRRHVRRLPAGPVDGSPHPDLNDGRSNGCAYADSPGTSHPADGQRVPTCPRTDHRPRADRPRRARLTSWATSRGASTCNSSTSSSPGSGSTGSRTASSPGQVRPAANHDHGLLAVDGGGRRSGHLGARRRLQLRQRPSPAGWPRSAWLPDGALPRRPSSQHHRGRSLMTATQNHPRPASGPPQAVVRHALATSTADDCLVIVRDPPANLRWASNTLTTSGVMGRAGRHRRLVRRHRDGLGHRQAPPPSRGVCRSSAPPTPQPARGRPGRDAAEAGPRRHVPDWDEPPVPADIHVYDAVAPPWAGVRPSRGAGRVLYGFVSHETTTTYVGSTTGSAAAPRCSPPATSGAPASADLSQQRLGGRRDARLQRRRPARHRRRAERRLAWAERRDRPPPGATTRSCPDSGGRPDDRRLLVGRRPGRLGGQSVYSSRRWHRIGQRIAREGVGLWSDPDPVAASACRSWWPPAPATPVRLRQLPLGRTDWIRDGQADLARADPAHRGDDRRAADAYVDNLALTVAGATGSIEDLVAGTERGPAADLPVVHPGGRPANPAADRADPRRRLPGRGRRDHGRGQQLPLQRGPVDLLGRFTTPRRRCRPSAASGGRRFSRTAMPALRVPDFNMSSVSRAL